MFLFSKLFHKDKKREENVNPNVIELPFGSFTFSDDDPREIGYEAEIDWNDKATVLEDNDYYKNFLSLIYPERRGLNNIIKCKK